MKPLNQPERQARLGQFSLLYLLALLIPLLASYYLFSNTSIADENTRLKAELDRTHEEQARFVTKFDTLTRRLQQIDAVDQRMRTETNDLVQGQLATKNQDYINSIAAGLSELRTDSAQMQVRAHRRLARNVLQDFDLFRSNRSTIELLRQDLTKRGDAAKGSERLVAELGQAKQQIVMLQAINSSKPAPAPAAAPAAHAAASAAAPRAAGPSGPSISTVIEMAVLHNQVSFAEADCLRQRALDHKEKSKERIQLLQQSRTAFLQLLQNPATADMKQSIEKTLEPINLELGRPAHFFGLF